MDCIDSLKRLLARAARRIGTFHKTDIFLNGNLPFIGDGGPDFSNDGFGTVNNTCPRTSPVIADTLTDYGIVTAGEELS